MLQRHGVSATKRPGIGAILGQHRTHQIGLLKMPQLRAVEASKKRTEGMDLSL